MSEDPYRPPQANLRPRRELAASEEPDLVGTEILELVRDARERLDARCRWVGAVCFVSACIININNGPWWLWGSLFFSSIFLLLFFRLVFGQVIINQMVKRERDR